MGLEMYASNLLIMRRLCAQVCSQHTHTHTSILDKSVCVCVCVPALNYVQLRATLPLAHFCLMAYACVSFRCLLLPLHSSSTCTPYRCCCCCAAVVLLSIPFLTIRCAAPKTIGHIAFVSLIHMCVHACINEYVYVRVYINMYAVIRHAGMQIAFGTCLSSENMFVHVFAYSIFDLSRTRTNMHAKCRDTIEIHEKLVHTIEPNLREVLVTLLVCFIINYYGRILKID